MKDLSVIIISYNTKDTTFECINRILDSFKSTPKFTAEIIVVDNASTDGSVEMIKTIKNKENIEIKRIFNTENTGFARANNEGLALAEGKYILFLNSDAFVHDINFEDLMYYMDKNPEVGVLTVKVMLPDGSIDKASHRGFPTIWNSFTYFTKLEKLFCKFPKLSKIFGYYHLTHLDLNTIHEIDSPSGAFYLTRSEIMKKVNGFDTAFFMYGEDLDLSYRIKELGYKIIYYPLFRVTHLKYQSGLKKNKVGVQKQTTNHFFQAMDIFYDKHFAPQNSVIENKLTHFFINLRSKLPR